MNADNRISRISVSCRKNTQKIYPSAFVNIYVKIPSPERKYKPLFSLDAISVDRTLLIGDLHDATGNLVVNLKISSSKHIKITSAELQHFALRVFSSKGQVLDDILREEHAKGSGCWGPELNSGKLVYITSASKSTEHHDVDHYDQALRALLRSTYVQNGDTIIAKPMSPDEEGCFQQIGFRRIGRTIWLGYAVDSSHPSHSLSIDDDVPSDNATHRSKDPEDWKRQITIACSLGAYGVSRTVSDECYPNRFFVHHTMYGGAAHVYGSPLFGLVHPTFYTPALCHPQLLIHTVESLVAKAPASLRAKDREGYTPLHMACAYFNLAAVKCLLKITTLIKQEDDNDSAPSEEILLFDDLYLCENVLYMTPLELCEAQLSLDRERTARKLSVRMDNLTGYALTRNPGRRMGCYEDGLRIAYILRCIMDLDVGGVASEDEYVELKTA